MWKSWPVIAHWRSELETGDSVHSTGTGTQLWGMSFCVCCYTSYEASSWITHVASNWMLTSALSTRSLEQIQARKYDYLAAYKPRFLNIIIHWSHCRYICIHVDIQNWLELHVLYKIRNVKSPKHELCYAVVNTFLCNVIYYGKATLMLYPHSMAGLTWNKTIHKTDCIGKHLQHNCCYTIVHSYSVEYNIHLRAASVLAVKTWIKTSMKVNDTSI